MYVPIPSKAFSTLQISPFIEHMKANIAQIEHFLAAVPTSVYSVRHVPHIQTGTLSMRSIVHGRTRAAMQISRIDT